MLVRDWLNDFLTDYRDRHEGRWPDPDTSESRRLFSSWMHELIKAKATQTECQLAALEIGGDYDWQPSDHLAQLIAGLQQIREQGRRLPADTSKSNREEAFAQSRGCEHCGGEGYAFAWNPDPKATENVRVPCTCLCLAGRWLRENLPRDVVARLPDFGMVWDGRGGYVPYNPSVPDVEIADDFVALRDWPDLVRRVKEATRCPQ